MGLHLLPYSVDNNNFPKIKNGSCNNIRNIYFGYFINLCSSVAQPVGSNLLTTKLNYFTRRNNTQITSQK